MKLLTLILIVTGFSLTSSAQKLWINTFVGVSNYQGDLQDKRFTFNQSHLAVGVGLSYELTEKILLNGGYTYGTVSASDKKNSRNTFRNLDFTSNISVGHLTTAYYFHKLYEHSA